MVYPARGHGGGRDGFGAGRQGRGTGRIGGRDFVWHCTERRIDGQGERFNRGGDPNPQQQDRATCKKEAGTDGDEQNENWERASLQAQVQHSSNLEPGEIGPGKTQKVDQKEINSRPGKNAERRTTGWNDGRGDT